MGHSKYAHIHEHNYDCFPHVWGDWHCPGMGDNLEMKTDTRYFSIDDPKQIPDNPMNSPQEEVEHRKIYYLDILDGKGRKAEFDLHGFSCPEAGVPELIGDGHPDESKPPSWIYNHKGPLTMIVKYLKFRFQWKGIQTAVESLVANEVFYYLHLDCHKALIKWSPEWSSKTSEELLHSIEELKAISEASKIDRD